MSQHDFEIANQTAANARTDINNALQALASLSSGNSAPSTTYANQIWYDASNNLLKIRNEANSAWITVGEVDQTNSRFNPVIGDWKILLSSTSLIFQYSGTAKGKLESNGDLTVVGNVTANGSI